MSDFLENIQQGPTEDSLAVIARVVTALDTVKDDIEKLADELKAREGQRKTLEANLAETLSKHRLSELRLQDGRKLTLAEDLKVKLPADPTNRKIVIDFIEANGGEGIVKDKLTLTDPSDSLVDALVERGEDFDRKSEVHPQTLAAFFREQLGMKKGSSPRINASDVPAEAGLFMYKKIAIR